MAYSTILEDGLKKDFSVTVDQISWIGTYVKLSINLIDFALINEIS